MSAVEDIAVPEGEPKDLHLRACASAYVVLIGINSVPLALWPIIVLRRDRLFFDFLLAALIAPTFFAIWLWRFRVDICEGTLMYSTLFSRRTIRLEDIKSARITWGITGNLWEPFHRITIQPTRESGLEPFHINIKPFHKDDIKRLMALLKTPKS